MRSTRSFAVFVAVALGAALFGGKAVAAGYPERPIELIVPWGPGGGADQLARLVSKLMEPMLGQGIPVVNVPGGTGATGMAKLLSAPADGYSMAIYIADSHALLAGKSPRWTMSDITPVAVMIKGPSFIFVKEDSEFKTWADFEKAAKANPGKLKVATLGFGSVDDFSLIGARSRWHQGRAGAVFQAERTLRLDSRRPCRCALRTGRRRRVVPRTASRCVRSCCSARSVWLHSRMCRPHIELGYKVALPQFRAIVVRAGTPPDVVKKLSDALAKVYALPEYKKFLEEQYADPNSFEDAAKAPAFVNEQLEDMKKTMATN